MQIEPVRGGFADRGEGVVDDVGHGQHGRPGVESVAADVGAAHATARVLASLDDGDAASAAGEMKGGRQPGQPGSDHDDPIVSVPPTVRITKRWYPLS